ncbi:4-hydroxyphenylacetate 3-hydroxylase N-terminal domain-containing protein [Aneurinibacillus aneurinilyticus]|uniref:Pyoverdin chromophore biosynthetic protein pvcC n=2 Tax=Aneurinibacillus aneurinilyticus TaxID=1391 RepID=A0A848CX42_ANEAE|nr:4-hydroxyphenylacetate 3-hydroxylase N-terminal domain-containing protein [Aneurinibacillus aneurinilyticus]MCI1696535.1 Pyoverdin chromophore biosynthetic protein pvcC [Aneurinibacillus aneurinilyticus]MED0671685.1 4-hydroxyphenylacetate 3-hydroxylase N-terminal domain-containing protein [Aneurinibacillus aneurinilyticus]NME97810.1 Pyoverdin chromophore biosynthetic protein pvcC [Aneurinibacillus aneurinilyticus]
MMNGKEYIESLRDNRTIYLNGEKIDDVTTHPAYRNSVRSIARLYDAIHDPNKASILTTKTEQGYTTHKFFKEAKSAQDLLEARDAIAEWAKLSYGFMGRSPDYKASFTAQLNAYSDYYQGFETNAKRWYEKAGKELPFINHTIINPQVDRSKSLHENKDVFVRAIAERDDGIIVSGAKMVGTSAALTHYNFVSNYGPTDLGDGDQSHALIFFVAMDTPGVKMISRQSFELQASRAGSPFNYPLSSRFDENDAVIVLDNVFVPWENVLAYKNINVTNKFFVETGFINRFTFQGCTRFAVKLDFMAGLLMKATEQAGTNQFRGVQANIGEVLAWRNLFWSLSTSMAADPMPGWNGTVMPNLKYGATYRTLAPFVWPKIKNIFEQVIAGGLIQLPSSAEDFMNPELRPYLDKYYRGSGVEAEERVKLYKMIWDAVGTEFGGRHELYEINYGGNTENIRLEMVKFADAMGDSDKYRSFVDQALSEYDLAGWTVDSWINPEKELIEQ